MEIALDSAAGAKEEIAKSKNPKIRLFTVPKKIAAEPTTELQGKWVECGPDTAGSFSAVAYYFGRDLQKARNVPVGLIHTSWGGTVAEAWTPQGQPGSQSRSEKAGSRHGRADAKYKRRRRNTRRPGKMGRSGQEGQGRRQDRAQAKAPSDPANPNRAGVLFNGMINPLLPYAIKGAIWYQGESNAGRAYQYRTLFPTMIESWREAWNNPDMPFLFVQLAPFGDIAKEPQESAWAELREAQLLTSEKLKNTGMAVITDVGEEKDIHPKHKEPVGGRLALAALAVAYGEKIVYSGPIYDGMEVDGNKAVLSFRSVGKGLDAKDGPLTGFTMAGEDKKFHKAKAEIKGDTVVVPCDAGRKAGRGALRLGQLPGRQPVEQGRPAGFAVPHGRFPRRHATEGFGEDFGEVKDGRLRAATVTVAARRNAVEPRGFEPRIPQCHCGVIPFHYGPKRSFG